MQIHRLVLVFFIHLLHLSSAHLKFGLNEYYLKMAYFIFSSPELAQDELLGYRDVRRLSYVWTSETYETSVRQLFSLCTL